MEQILDRAAAERQPLTLAKAGEPPGHNRGGLSVNFGFWGLHSWDMGSLFQQASGIRANVNAMGGGLAAQLSA